ncbi:SDR family oxidoreductase [Paenibacillus silvae]|uniref:Oxidoreductase n=1 Tax=Paenibacillus silvae TaxID=1325358 RepID=A0A2W6NAB2_9BACL|nr:SDR family oxidoreductase [Paenibacillus silvae]MCK6073315.1 SDR family oxidoreductase [Paenibacillus silvae]MCK6149209.1 SDR family oxidoreductase [Paenibacillus silvae]MCK6267508.1 SDR family oxidoreductase [Paenibacillus silvae]PZT52885.1 oxidoreductase [Paenibacillus silvae]
MTQNQRKIAIITGASGPREMGSAFCRKLASRDIDIFFTHYKADPEWIIAFHKEIEDMGVRCASLDVDLAERYAAKQVYERTVQKLGKPSILINNAAYCVNADYQDFDAELMDNHYSVNMRSTFLLCTIFAREFEKSSLTSGRIINMTSGQDISPMPGELAYVATKGAISAFTKSLSRELAPLKITVNAVNPGPTDTTWMDNSIRDYLLPKFPLGRIGAPEDAANLIDFLVSEAGAWITGQVIHSEGGFIRE